MHFNAVERLITLLLFVTFLLQRVSFLTPKGLFSIKIHALKNAQFSLVVVRLIVVLLVVGVDICQNGVNHFFYTVIINSYFDALKKQSAHPLFLIVFVVVDINHMIIIIKSCLHPYRNHVIE